MNERKLRQRDFEILAKILDACSDWAKPYHIFAKCSARWASSKKILDDLENRHLVEKKTVLQAIRYKDRHALSKTPRTHACVFYKRTVMGSEFLHWCKVLISIWTINTRTQNESKL